MLLIIKMETDFIQVREVMLLNAFSIINLHNACDVISHTHTHTHNLSLVGSSLQSYPAFILTSFSQFALLILSGVFCCAINRLFTEMSELAMCQQPSIINPPKRSISCQTQR